MKTDKKPNEATKLNSTGVNLLIIFIGLVVAIVVASETSSNMPASSNHGAIFPYFNAVIFGIITLVAYFSFKNILKNYSWLITLIGVILMIFASTTI